VSQPSDWTSATSASSSQYTTSFRPNHWCMKTFFFPVLTITSPHSLTDRHGRALALWLDMTFIFPFKSHYFTSSMHSLLFYYPIQTLSTPHTVYFTLLLFVGQCTQKSSPLQCTKQSATRTRWTLQYYRNVNKKSFSMQLTTEVIN